MLESKYSKVLTIVLIVIIVAILVLLGFLAINYINTSNNTKQASEFVESYQGDITIGDDDSKPIVNGIGNTITNTVETGTELINSVETPIQSGSSGSGSSSSSGSNKRTYQGLSVAGTMKIPSISLEYPLVEDITTTALEKALVVLYPSGDNLNLPGNTVIIGHNYRNGTFFSNLKKLSNGAKIYVTDFRGTTLTYEVYNIFTAGQTDTSFYTRDTNGLAELTLSTCTDASDNQRTIVFAKQVQ